MKFCSKCGNQMTDEMMFCQKCGTKFVLVTDSPKREIDRKLSKMHNYNLVLDGKTLTWDYVQNNTDHVKEIILMQEKLCVELVALVKDILSSVDNEERDLVEREVYLYILNAGYQMCVAGEKMLSDYTGKKELFDKATAACSSGLMDPLSALNMVHNQDYIYRALAGAQGFQSSQIKAALNGTLIYNNNEYRELTKKFAQAFNNMWTAFVKRYTDFFMSPGQPAITKHWELYLVLLQGLRCEDIDSLDEKGWMLALDDDEKNHGGAAFKREFLKKRDQQRAAMRKEEKEREDQQYWKSHPEELKQKEEKTAQINRIKKEIAVLDQEIEKLQNTGISSASKRSEIEKEILDKQKKVLKLSKRIFGKNEAATKAESLKKEIEGLSNELTKEEEIIEIETKQLDEKQRKKKALENQLEQLERDIILLRNK